MKDHILAILFALFMFNTCPILPAMSSMAEINAISNQAMSHSDQIRVNFTDSVNVDYGIDASTGACVLSLKNVPHNSSLASRLAQKIKQSSPRNISNVTPFKITDEATGEEGTGLTITFSNKNVHLNVQTLEHPHQLIIDVISNNLLRSKLKGNGVIAQAFNGLHAHYAAHILV